MQQPIYGVINSDGVLIDTSKTLQGAKNYATRNDYTKVGYRIGYNAFIEAEKVNGKWVVLSKYNSFNSNPETLVS